MEKPGQGDHSSQLPSAHLVEYASPGRKPPHSAWSVVGFALAIVSAVPPGMIWWNILSAIYESRAAGVNSFPVHIVVAVDNSFLIPLVPICACLIGLRRGRKSLAIVGIVIATVSMIAMVILVVKPSW